MAFGFRFRFLSCASVHGASNKLGDWVIEYAIILHGVASNGGHERNKIRHQGSLGDEDDARTSNTCIVQRKHAIPLSMMKTNCNIIECCNNNHQGRRVPPNKHVLALQTTVMLVTLLVCSYRLNGICVFIIFCNNIMHALWPWQCCRWIMYYIVLYICCDCSLQWKT